MEFMTEHLAALRKRNLYRETKTIYSSQSKYVNMNGKKIMMMCSNSYLDLCGNIRLKNAAKAAIDKYGVASGGSRLTTGSYNLHEKLEMKIAEFKKTEKAILFNTGYMANVGTISAVADREWIIFSDRLNHASIIDGCRLSGAKIVIYNHCDADDLEHKIKLNPGCKRMIITDGVFSMDGDIAPLDKIVRLAEKNNIITMVDDAHGTGVLGERGSGSVEHFDLQERVDIQLGTLSKAISSEGGFVAGSKSLIDYLKQKSRSFIYSTSLSPAVVAVSLEALDIVEHEIELRKNLLENAAWFREKLEDAGFKVLKSQTPIIPVIIESEEKTMELSEKLLEKGLFINAIRPPTVPKDSSRLRITLMATHNKREIKYALDLLKETALELKIQS